jgi:hypothetical protein
MLVPAKKVYHATLKFSSCEAKHSVLYIVAIPEKRHKFLRMAHLGICIFLFACFPYLPFLDNIVNNETTYKEYDKCACT